MAYDVAIDLGPLPVGNKDIEVEVRSDGKKLGTVLISKGNIEWLPSGNSVNKHRLTWKKFAQLMESSK